MKRIAVLLLAVLLPHVRGIAEEALPVVTLTQSIDAALSNGYDNKILLGNLAVGRAQHAQNESRNSFFLTGSLGYGDNETTSTTDPYVSSALKSLQTVSPQGGLAGLAFSGPLTSAALSATPYSPVVGGGATLSSYVLTVSQTLWNGYPGGPPKAAVEKSQLALQGRELSTESGRLNLIYRVKQAYYTMLSAQRNISLRREILDKQNSLLGQISAIYDLKQASVADLKTAQVNAQSAEIDLRSAEHDLRLARIRLAIVMGRSTDEGFTVAEVEDPRVKAATLEEAVADGLGRRTEIKQVDLNRKSNGIDLALIRGQTTPSVSVNGGGAFLVNLTSGKNAWAWGLSAKVGLPLLDAELAKRQQEEKLSQDAVYAAQEEQLQKSIAADIQDAYETAQIQRERLAVARLAAETYDLQLEVVRTQNQYGTATNQDLLTAAVNSANARNALAAATSAAQLAVLQLQNIMGY